MRATAIPGKIKRGAVSGSIAALMLLCMVPVASAQLAAVGPNDPVNHYPSWYQDQNLLQLELCIPNGGGCLADPPVTGNVFSQTTGFGEEAFYWSAEASVPAGNTALVSGIVILALEAAYASAVPRDGRQIVFSRLRIRLNGLPNAGPYTVIHPYGQRTFTATPDPAVTGTFLINFTQDVGAAAVGNFTRALNGPITGPFLTAVNPAPPAGFIGNPRRLQTVTGSPTGNNFIRIIGPAGTDIGGPAATPNTITIRRFNLMGRIFTP